MTCKSTVLWPQSVTTDPQPIQWKIYWHSRLWIWQTSCFFTWINQWTDSKELWANHKHTHFNNHAWTPNTNDKVFNHNCVQTNKQNTFTFSNAFSSSLRFSNAFFPSILFFSFCLLVKNFADTFTHFVHTTCLNKKRYNFCNIFVCFETNNKQTNKHKRSSGNIMEN